MFIKGNNIKCTAHYNNRTAATLCTIETFCRYIIVNTLYKENN